MIGKKVVAVSIMATLAICVCACADGVFVWKKGVDLYGPSQKAIILYDEGVEDLILQVKYKGPASDFAWIVPVPNKPEVKAVKGDIFAGISLYTQSREWWAAFIHWRDTTKKDVEVIERKKISVYDVAVLSAEDAQALIKWLNENGFSVPDKAKRILSGYIKKNWTFVALRIHPDEQNFWVEKSLNKGTLVPLKFTFSSKEIVYPLKISSLNKGETEVLIYVFYKDAVVHPDFWTQAPAALEFYKYFEIAPLYVLDTQRLKFRQKDRKRFAEFFDFEHKFFRPVRKNELPLCRKALPRLNNGNFFLSKLSNTFKADEMQYDIILKPVEKLTERDKYLFVKKQIEGANRNAIKISEERFVNFSNSLLLRAPEQVAEYIAKELIEPKE